jgi:hypothetical protein
MRQGKGSILMLIYDEFGALLLFGLLYLYLFSLLQRFSIFTNDMCLEVLWRFLNLFGLKYFLIYCRLRLNNIDKKSGIFDMMLLPSWFQKLIIRRLSYTYNSRNSFSKFTLLWLQVAMENVEEQDLDSYCVKIRTAA